MRKIQKYLIPFFCLTVGICVLPALKFPGGYRVFVVESESMMPSIKPKSLVVVKSVGYYRLNEIITFYDTGKYPTTTHRIKAILNKDNRVYYKAGGDANLTDGDELIPEEKVVGKVMKVIDHLGWVIDFVKSSFGLVIFVYTPAVIIIWNELRNLRVMWYNSR